MNVRRGDLVYPELSYEIVGILYDVYNEIGYNHKEKIIQKAIEVLLKKRGYSYEKELRVDIEIEGEKVGYYSLDFLIENKVVLETKRKDKFDKCDFDQVKKYLKTKNRKLGILANFTNRGMIYQRVLKPVK
jgi:GxxExxY protein